MKVSVIVTVKNEGQAIRPLLESLGGQTRRPDEIVICDGGSTDNTTAILEEYRQRLPLRLVEVPGSNISQGRNRAIEAAGGPIIAATDAGVVLDPHWLAELVRPIEEQGSAVASGWFAPDPRTDFETVMGATVLPDLADIDPRQFLPSSRSVAFLKSAWEQAGGYPEWLDYGEDLVFDLSLRERYGSFPFVPEAVAYFRPRAALKAYARQYYLYAKGDGKAKLWPKRHAIRYLTYLVALPGLLRLCWRKSLLGWIVLLTAGSLYCRRPVQRLWPMTRTWAPCLRARAVVLVPIIRLVGDVAKMIGYPVGVLWRLKHRPPDLK